MPGLQRPILKQEGTTLSFQVTTAAASPNPALGLTSLIDSFVITVPSSAANSVFIGFDQGVTTTTGLELLAGTSSRFTCSQDRQLYELQNLLIKMLQCMGAMPGQFEDIPFVCWDMSSVFLIAAANTTVSVGLFKAVYI